MNPSRRYVWGALVSVVLVAAGCSASSDDEEAAGGEALLPPSVVDAAAAPIDGPIGEQIDLDGREVWLGSTVDDEGAATDRLLAALTARALTEAGADVRRQDGLGGGAARDALTAGEIDLYWEGAGDAWTALLRQPADGLSGAEVLDRLARRDLEENGVAWLDAVPVDDGPRFAESAEPSEGSPVGRLSAMRELLAAEDGDEIVVCVTSAFTTYPDDGRVAVEEALDLTFADDQLRAYEPEPIYPETADGVCRFGLVENTGGRVAEYGLAVLEDDVGAFLPNPLAPAMREDVLLEQPELATLLNALAARLDADELREMNRRVVIDGTPVDAVADEWLAAEGLLGDGA